MKVKYIKWGFGTNAYSVETLKRVHTLKAYVSKKKTVKRVNEKEKEIIII